MALAGVGFLFKLFPSMIFHIMKRFLRDNKIYFEVFSFLVIGICGLIITYYQYKVASQELAIHQSQASPLLRLEL
ncbi:hypothetical protein GCM10011375_27510 [Hymenobacter qilianensis]|uniref:Uncharacterized protein n=1 Tax=Hymenobacter qilianensis TaxID=1385715 RepID=A0ACB5PTN3_9BACT|nr:hypothetical protein GCM10011375_27510 [Hymenobacter qilianensis]